MKIITTYFLLTTKQPQPLRCRLLRRGGETLLSFLLFTLTLFCLATPLQAAELKLNPRLCLHYPQQACQLQLKVSWQQQEPACLYQKAQQQPLLCGDGKEQLLSLNLAGHTRFELRSQQDGTLLDSRLVRVLQVDLNAGDQLLKRSRASWGNP